MSKPINIYEAKTRLSQLVERAEKGEEIVIAGAGRPVARLIAWKPRPVPRKPGRLRGRIRIHKNFDSPLPDDFFATIKQQLGRIEIDLAELEAAAVADGFSGVSAQIAHALRASSLPTVHRDPFDRLLIAQAIETGSRLLTRDDQILAYAGTPGFDPVRA